jgi:hypothetical protein
MYHIILPAQDAYHHQQHQRGDSSSSSFNDRAGAGAAHATRERAAGSGRRNQGRGWACEGGRTTGRCTTTMARA